jgi:heat-inducible transcriptional repressor
MTSSSKSNPPRRTESSENTLDARKEAILRTIVEQHVATAQPVGSQAVTVTSGLDVSSATVRNEMQALEQEGYIRQPHTSAGRVPTDQGYRYFVDSLPTPGLSPVDRRTVADFFGASHRAIEDLLNETSQLLARVSEHAAVVVGPPPERTTVRSVQLVSLHPGVVLAVAVLADGHVEKEEFDVDADLGDESIAAASAQLTDTAPGSALRAMPKPAPSGRASVDELVARVHARFVDRADSNEPVYVGGTSRLAAESDAFTTVEQAAQVLEVLEEQFVVVSMIRALLDDGITVRIGSENEMVELRDCSIVIAPYAVEGELAGTVGVLGPTRMDYRRALAAVDTVSRQLNRILSS